MSAADASRTKCMWENSDLAMKPSIWRRLRQCCRGSLVGLSLPGWLVGEMGGRSVTEERLLTRGDIAIGRARMQMGA